MRVSVEQECLNDPRFSFLGKAVKMDPDLARMKCVRVWFYCLDRMSDTLPAEYIDELVCDGFAAAMVRANLAEQLADDIVRVRGVRDEISVIEKKVLAGRIGGRMSVKVRNDRALKQPLTSASPAAQAPSEAHLKPSKLSYTKLSSEKLCEEPAAAPPDVLRVLSYLNQKTGKKFRPSKPHVSLVGARLREHSVEELCRVVDDRVRRWSGDAKMREYLRPQTLFNATKFASYIDEAADATPGGGDAEWLWKVARQREEEAKARAKEQEERDNARDMVPNA